MPCRLRFENWEDNNLELEVENSVSQKKVAAPILNNYINALEFYYEVKGSEI